MMTWIAVCICALVSFVFAGVEAGILSVNRVRLKHRLKHGDRAAATLNRLLARPGRLLVTVLLVTNLANIFALTIATQAAAQSLGAMGYVAVGIIALPVYLLGVELLPKALFRCFPYRALAVFARPLEFADHLLAPLHAIGDGITRLLLGRRPAQRAKLLVAREDFKYLTIQSEHEGTLTPAERQMIHNVVDFRAIAARDVMTPIEKVHAVCAGSPVPELLAQHTAAHIDRWPVLGPKGEVLGLVNVLDIALDGRFGGVVDEFQRRIVKVAANEPAYSILRKLRAARTTLAAVLGSDAKPIGIVTWEDLIRRLVNTAVP
jgi:CBS domain containing-hemolysin-like protein